jgi:hypothetical protein
MNQNQISWVPNKRFILWLKNFLTDQTKLWKKSKGQRKRERWVWKRYLKEIVEGV